MADAGSVDFLNDIIEIAVAIELEVAAVYDLFASTFAENEELSIFWRLYAETERYHAATIRIHQSAFAKEATQQAIDAGEFPTQLEESKKFLDQLRSIRQTFTDAPATLAQAFAAARTLENDAAEIHGRTQFFKVYPQFHELFVSLVEEDLGHRQMLDEAALRFGG